MTFFTCRWQAKRFRTTITAAPSKGMKGAGSLQSMALYDFLSFMDREIAEDGTFANVAVQTFQEELRFVD